MKILSRTDFTVKTNPLEFPDKLRYRMALILSEIVVPTISYNPRTMLRRESYLDYFRNNFGDDR